MKAREMRRKTQVTMKGPTTSKTMMIKRAHRMMQRQSLKAEELE